MYYANANMPNASPIQKGTFTALTAASHMSTQSNPYQTQCAHCKSFKSPLWRRGEHGEMLCNACGLYWRNHRTMRPKDFILKPRSAPMSPLMQSSAISFASSRSNTREKLLTSENTTTYLRKLFQDVSRKNLAKILNKAYENNASIKPSRSPIEVYILFSLFPYTIYLYISIETA